MVPPDVKIVDFEYANSGPPLMDLTIFSMGCELTVEEETVLLTSYYSEPAIKWETKLPTIDDAFLAKFGALKVLACLRASAGLRVADRGLPLLHDPSAVRRRCARLYARVDSNDA